jgi:hypothetical protein
LFVLLPPRRGAVKGIPYTLLDGADGVNKDVRNALFAVSGKRAQYPQAFIVRGGPVGSADATPEFVGDWEAIHGMNERDADDGSFDTAFAAVKPGAGAASGAGATGAHGSDGVGAGGVDSAAAGAGREEHAAAGVAAAASGAGAMPVPTDADAGTESGGSSGAGAGGAAAGASPATSAVWQKHVDKAGDVFWFRPDTGETSWVDPTTAGDSPWVELHDDANDAYYYNRVTGETSWTLPAGATAGK